MVKLNTGKFLKKEDCKDGDSIKILDEGHWELSTRFKYIDGNPVNQFILEIEHNGEKKKFTANKNNRDILILAFGNDTVDWKGQTVKLSLVHAMIGGKMQKTIMLITEKTGKPNDSPEVAWDN